MYVESLRAKFPAVDCQVRTKRNIKVSNTIVLNREQAGRIHTVLVIFDRFQNMLSLMLLLCFLLYTLICLHSAKSPHTSSALLSAVLLKAGPPRVFSRRLFFLLSFHSFSAKRDQNAALGKRKKTKGKSWTESMNYRAKSNRTESFQLAQFRRSLEFLPKLFGWSFLREGVRAWISNLGH